MAERDQGADHEHPPSAMIEMRPRPDVAPGITGDQVLEIGIERIAVGDRFVDPFITEHLAALGHAVVAALVVVHGILSCCHCEERLVRRSSKSEGESDSQ